MTLADALIPFGIGILLVLRPQVFVRGTGAGDEVAKKRARVRKIGYVLVAVALLYAAVAWLES